jgi:hypothetical protein
MAFLTDLDDRQELTLVCENDLCALDKLTIRIRVTKKSNTKVRISIDADRDVRIDKLNFMGGKGNDRRRKVRNQKRRKDDNATPTDQG